MKRTLAHTMRRAWAGLRYALHLGRWARMLAFCARRFLQDDGPRLAAGLSYATLLSLVPLLAIGLGIMAAFPAFEPMRQRIADFFLTEMLPERGVQINAQLTQFVENAGQLTGAGTVALAVAVILVLANIQDAFNKIWRVTEPRPIAIRLMTYWALLTLGPLFLGSSLYVTSYAFAAVQWSGIGESVGGVIEIAWIISILLAGAGFALIYLVVPNRRVEVRHALLGGLTAAFLLELLKYLFGLYLRNFPSYEAIYGALATVPIFLIWMFLAWAVVLFGAEIVAGLPEWRAAIARGAIHQSPGERLALGLSILERLQKAATAGEGSVRERRLSAGLPSTPAEIEAVLKALRKEGFVERSPGARWVLARDLRHARLQDLLAALSLQLDAGKGWPRSSISVIEWLQRATRPETERSLEELLDEEVTEAGVGSDDGASDDEKEGARAAAAS